jgi:hypothetical protein
MTGLLYFTEVREMWGREIRLGNTRLCIGRGISRHPGDRARLLPSYEPAEHNAEYGASGEGNYYGLYRMSFNPLLRVLHDFLSGIGAMPCRSLRCSDPVFKGFGHCGCGAGCAVSGFRDSLAGFVEHCLKHDLVLLEN